MDVVKRKRPALKTNIIRLENDSAPFDLTNLMVKIEIQVQLKELQLIKDQYRKLLEDCTDVATTDAEYQNEEKEFLALEQRLAKISIKLSGMMEAHGGATTTTAATGSSDVKLPKLELPTFSGEVKDWLSFQDLFVASVHNNPKLSGAQKLQYLKASLKGEPATLLQNIQVTDLNYDGAWDTLKTRYENQREIIKSHFDRLLSLPTLTQENPDILRRLGDSTSECVRALEVMKITAEQSRDLLMIHLISRKFDSESRLEWERSLKPNSIPTIKEFTDFILQHARVTAAAGVRSKMKENLKPTSFVSEKKVKTHVGTESSQENCSLCKKSKHYLSRCEDFKNMKKVERVEYLKKSGRCFNCLEKSHRSQYCTWKYNCRTCGEKHHSLIHFGDESKKNESEQKKPESTTEESQASKNLFACNMGISDSARTLLSTALIQVRNEKNQIFVCRALLDNGSQTSFITKKCATKIGLKRHKVNLPISGIGDLEVGTSQLGVELEFCSKYNSKKKFSVEAHLMKNITGDLPCERINVSSWTHIEGLQLADPFFHEPGHIDVLLGGEIYEDLMKSKRRQGPEGTPWARESHLGWILLGKYKTNQKPQPTRVHHATSDFVSSISNFWELEEVPLKQRLTIEERKCEEHFEENCDRDSEGRYVVKLPFKENRPQIGESRYAALKRFYSMERRYSSSPEKMKEINDVLQGYLDLNHMEKVPDIDVIKKSDVYYMPYHVVLNPNSATTPVRVVFDASAKSSNGVSLNDCLMVGPKIQDDMIVILMRFLIPVVPLSSDMPKMYRQVKIHKDDVDYQRIVWRKSKDEPIQDYRLMTATFGTASAPYQAVKSVQHLAKTEKENFPKAAEVICRDFYVDDLLTGAANQDEAKQLIEDLLALLKKGKFDLRKWSSNDVKVLESLPMEMRETKETLEIDMDHTIKTLGLMWHPAGDFFSFKVNVSEISAVTKRQVLSETAKIFDPLGWLSPVTMKAKIFFQELWRAELDWDDKISEDQLAIWRKYTDELPLLKRINIQRRCTLDSSEKYFLDGYCDASEKAYAAVVYLRCENQDERMTRLIASKTKVAPVNSRVTLPRLELCGAVLLRRLMQCVHESLNLKIEKMTAWTDSTIVLGWIAKHPSVLKTFVGNRISEIQEFLPIENWAHIPGLDNPADCASRGIYPSELENHTLWWFGPPHTYPSQEQSPEEETSEEFLKEIKEPTLKTLTASITKLDIDTVDLQLKRESRWLTLQRTVAWVLRYLENRKNNPETKRSGALSVPEMNKALMVIVKKMQRDPETGFLNEIENLKQGKKVSKPLRRWTPFLDNDGILRVGGRLENAEIDFDKKQPLSFEEMLTILKEIEACLNSRPLSSLSTDPNDLAALTPGHFLTGDALTAIPVPDLTTLKINRLGRWPMTQQIVQHFWRRWSAEYLSRMQEKPKWWNTKKNLEVGNLVLIKDDNHPPLMWKMAKIIEVKPGKDELVRVVKLNTQDGHITRPVEKLCLLPMDK